MPLKRTLWSVLFIVATLFVDLLWLHTWSTVILFVQATLFVVLLTTITRPILTSLLVAVIAGLGYAFFSAANPWPYLVAFPAACLVAYIFIHRLATTRSLTSLLATVAVGTLAYYLTMVILVLVLSLVRPSSLRSPISSLLLPATIQIFFHPLLAMIIWRLLGRGQYERIQTLATPL